MQTDVLRIATHETVRYRMKSTGPGQPRHAGRIMLRARPSGRGGSGDDAPRAPDHFMRRTPRKGEQQYAFGRDTIQHQMRDTVSECICLTGSGAGDDE